MLDKLRIVSLLLAGLILSGCTTIYNPATQRRESFLIDTKSEIALGKDLDAQIQNKLKILHNSQIQSRLDAIGSQIARVCDRQDVVYYFKIIRDKELNAFSIPGGFVYVNSALMNISSDDELACVLAHEIGHIAARHSVKRLQVVLGYQMIANIALGLSGQYDLGRAMDVVFNLASLGYSRKDEFLADNLAVKYASKAGFNSYGMVTFFEKLKKEQESRGSGARLVFLSSHPDINERIKNAQNQISQIKNATNLSGKPQ
jgi:predicted Zn-dependent protease